MTAVVAMLYLPPAAPFPATVWAEGRQFNGAPFPATAWAEGRQFNGAPSPHGARHARLTDGAVGWAGTARMGLGFAIANPLRSPWAFNGLWLSRYSHWRRAGRGSGCLLALCGPAAHRCGHARLAHRAAGA